MRRRIGKWFSDLRVGNGGFGVAVTTSGRRLRPRSKAWTAIVVGAAAFIAPLAPAASRAAQIRHWHIESRFVDASKISFTPSFDPFGPIPPPSHPLRSLPVNVYLPNGYDPDHRYPVLYLPHGIFDNYRAWIDPELGDLRRVARGFPGVIVMPEADRGGYINWWNGGRRGDPAWERYFFEELIPLVEHRLSIRSGRRWHAIAGFSLGGLGATFLGSQRPGYFGSVPRSRGRSSTPRTRFFPHSQPCSASTSSGWVAIPWSKSSTGQATTP